MWAVGGYRVFSVIKFPLSLSSRLVLEDTPISPGSATPRLLAVPRNSPLRDNSLYDWRVP